MSKRRQMVVDTEGIIGFLQDNLRDRYKDCFLIIQELLQNADDAKAKRVHFGMFKGIPNAGSLFQGPAFLVVNDGPVRPSDLDAIYRIAAGNKRADDNKIGKFGLGMKSVFHVCEAFFMFGKGLDVQEDLPGFCSPWSEDFHKEWWDEWDQDINIATRVLEDIIGPLVKSWPRWFCVWIPMRNAKQLGYIAPILKTMPDIGTYEELVGADSCEKAARMLPLLKNIEEFSFKDWDGECRKYVLKSKGRLLPESCILSGDVVAEGKGGSGFSYFGEARLHNTDRQFLELQSLDCWPESTHKELLRKAETIVDKTKPHTAVCIMTETSSSPHVSVLPCVFLPLSGAYDKTDEYSADSGGKLAVRVCLHGSMFVDAGRQGFNIGNKLLNLPKNDIELRGEWNRRLFFDAVLPMLIPQVKKLLAEVDKEESIAIMKALSQIEYLSEHMTQICHDNFLVYELTSTGYSWNVVSAKDEIIALSSPRSSLVRKVLCESLPEHVHIIDSSAGCLVKNNIIKSSLSSEIRVAVLRTIAGMPQEELNNEDLLRFARDCASGLKFPELDEDLRLAPIWKVGNDRLSYEAIKIKSEELQIYSESISGLRQKFLSAVEWTVSSAPWELGTALGLQFRKLDVDFAIDVLHKHPRLKTVEERVDLLVALKSNAAQDWARQRSAVRYLIHGVAELFDNDAKLYTPDASLPAEFSEVVMKALSRALYHYSYSIPLKMLAKLSDEEQIEYGFGRLTKDSVAVTLANTPNISYIGFPEDAWQTLLRVSDRLFTDHMVKSALKRIPIFPFENGKRGALDDDSCYYESNVKIPTVFRETINVILIPKDEDIARRIKELVKSWRYADTFRFCRESLLPCNQLSEILTDAVTRTPSLSAEDRAYLVEIKWVPMSKGGYCQPDSIINIDGFEPPADITSKVPLNAFEDSVLSFLRRHSLLTDVTICVERFFAELAENPRYCLGRIRQSDGEDLSCDTIFSVFKNQEVLPVVSILKGMSGNKSICDNYLRLLIRPIDSDLMLGVITELTTQIRECRTPSEKQRYWRFLNSYLDEAAEYDDSVFGDMFSVYEFLNLKNTLAKASELCTGGESIPSRYIISSEYKAATEFFSRLHDNQTYYVKENKDAEYSSYKEYFSDWDQDYDARIGGFIICTSDSDEDIKFVKERYWTDSRSIRENRNKLNGIYDELLKGQCAYLHAKKGSKVLIRTLIGTFHEVSMKGLDEVDNLFVSEGAPLHISPSPSARLAVYNGGGPKLMIMRLRYVTKEELQRLSPARVDSLLKNTLHAI